MKQPPLGVWIECRIGNMPEDFYCEGYAEVEDWYSSTPLVIVSHTACLADMRHTSHISVQRSRAKGHKRWHWSDNKVKPTHWLAIPPYGDYEHLKDCKTIDDVEKVIML